MLTNLVYTTALCTMDYFSCKTPGATPSGTCSRRAGACTRSPKRGGGGEEKGKRETAEEKEKEWRREMSALTQHQQHTHTRTKRSESWLVNGR